MPQQRRTPRLGRHLVLATLALAQAMVVPQMARAADNKVTPSDQLEFQEKNVTAQMEELQERMYHLADLVKQSEPTDSARLLMGVRKAREELIVEQMKQVMDLIHQKDLENATQQQQVVLTKLEELKQLLLSTDLDLQLQLEQLKQLKKAIAKLDVAIKEQQRQLANTSKLSEQQKKNLAKPGDFQSAQQDQQKNHKNTDAVRDMIKDLGEKTAKAGELLGLGGQSMTRAEGSLGSQKPSEACDSQVEASGELQQARAELEAQRQALLAQITPSIRKLVVENLTQMLETQKTIRESNEVMQPRLAKGQREAVLSIKRMAPIEEKMVTIADQTIELVEETEFSFALPPALKSVERRILYVAGDLTAGHGDQKVVIREKQIEQDLADLIDTFKQAPLRSMGESNCKGCKGNKNTLLAELKTIRLLQTRVNEETRDADENRVAAANLTPDLRDTISDVKDQQDTVRDTTDRLDAAVTGREPAPAAAPDQAK